MCLLSKFVSCGLHCYVVRCDGLGQPTDEREYGLQKGSLALTNLVIITHNGWKVTLVYPIKTVCDKNSDRFVVKK